MSKRWGVWSRLFVVIGVLWTIGFPVTMWCIDRAAAMRLYTTGLQLCYRLVNTDPDPAALDSCLAEQRFHGPGFDTFAAFTGVGIALMGFSIIVFLIIRATIRWILAGRKAA